MGRPWVNPRALAILGLCSTLLLWTVWVAVLSMKASPAEWGEPSMWLLGLFVVPLFAWPVFYGAGLLIRLVRRGDMSDVGTYGGFLVLFGLPATFIGCPLMFPGLVLIAASIWQRQNVRRATR